MTATEMKPRVTSFAPQFLVDDLERSIAYYQRLGFSFGEPWGGFYAIGYLDGLELHLKEAPKNPAERHHRRENEHLDEHPGKDIWLMGGGELIASFLDAQAIDEFVISVAPVFIGDGIPLIARRHRHVPLELRSNERCEDGLVQLHYGVQNKQT